VDGLKLQKRYLTSRAAVERWAHSEKHRLNARMFESSIEQERSSIRGSIMTIEKLLSLLK